MSIFVLFLDSNLFRLKKFRDNFLKIFPQGLETEPVVLKRLLVLYLFDKYNIFHRANLLLYRFVLAGLLYKTSVECHAVRSSPQNGSSVNVCWQETHLLYCGRYIHVSKSCLYLHTDNHSKFPVIRMSRTANYIRKKLKTIKSMR